MEATSTTEGTVSRSARIYHQGKKVWIPRNQKQQENTPVTHEQQITATSGHRCQHQANWEGKVLVVRCLVGRMHERPT